MRIANLKADDTFTVRLTKIAMEAGVNPRELWGMEVSDLVDQVEAAVAADAKKEAKGG